MRSGPLAPVQAATATEEAVPRYLTGQGTITAANTATVRSRVDGQVQYVATGNLVVAAISRQNADKAPVPSFMLKDSPCFIGLKKNEPALKAKVDTLIEQGIKDGTLNGLSEKWLKAPLPASLGA